MKCGHDPAKAILSYLEANPSETDGVAVESVSLDIIRDELAKLNLPHNMPPQLRLLVDEQQANGRAIFSDDLKVEEIDPEYADLKSVVAELNKVGINAKDSLQDACGLIQMCGLLSSAADQQSHLSSEKGSETRLLANRSGIVVGLVTAACLIVFIMQAIEVERLIGVSRDYDSMAQNLKLTKTSILKDIQESRAATNEDINQQISEVNLALKGLKDSLSASTTPVNLAASMVNDGALPPYWEASLTGGWRDTFPGWFVVDQASSSGITASKVAVLGGAICRTMLQTGMGGSLVCTPASSRGIAGSGAYAIASTSSNRVAYASASSSDLERWVTSKRASLIAFFSGTTAPPKPSMKGRD
jgi:hypothetical protein